MPLACIIRNQRFATPIGHTMEQRYQSFLDDIRSFVDAKRVYTDDLRLLAWGTDAGFYRLLPKIVIRSTDEREVAPPRQPTDFR